jgi:hypothetical protein
MMWYLCGRCKPVEDWMLNGINSPVAGPLADPEALTRTAAEGEVMGFDYRAFSDHIARFACLGAGLTSRTLPALIDVASTSGAFREFA